MGSVLPFPARRRRRPVETPLFPASIAAFPPARVGWRVADIARRVARSQTDGSTIIRRAADYERIRLLSVGVEPADVEIAVRGLVGAICARLWRGTTRRPSGDAA